MKCKEALKNLFDIDDSEIAIYRILLKGEKKVNEIGEIMGKERSTIYRHLQKLIKCGMVGRERKIMDGGGYYYVYRATPPDELKKWLIKCIDRWQREMREAVKKIEKEII